MINYVANLNKIMIWPLLHLRDTPVFVHILLSQFRFICFPFIPHPPCIKFEFSV